MLISFFFKGHNGVGTIDLQVPYLGIGALRPQVLFVQRIVSDISDATIDSGPINATDSFGTEIVSGRIDQTASNDFSDALFYVIIKLP